jgi:hypothetical protein
MQSNYRAEQSAGYVQLTNLTAATALTVPAGASLAIIQAEAQPIRWRDDGADPTASVGMYLSVGQELQYSGAQLSRLKLIAATAGAIANITFYRQGV